MHDMTWIVMKAPLNSNQLTIAVWFVFLLVVLVVLIVHSLHCTGDLCWRLISLSRVLCIKSWQCVGEWTLSNVWHQWNFHFLYSQLKNQTHSSKNKYPKITEYTEIHHKTNHYTRKLTVVKKHMVKTCKYPEPYGNTATIVCLQRWLFKKRKHVCSRCIWELISGDTV